MLNTTCWPRCRVLQANNRAVFTTLRTRLCCEVYRGIEKLASHQAFNEACLDRGLGLNFLQMDCYIDGSFVTTVQVRTPITSAPMLPVPNRPTRAALHQYNAIELCAWCDPRQHAAHIVEAGAGAHAG